MVADKWLVTIGTIARTLFWGMGYFVGFTVVSALSLGAVVPAGFDEIFRGQKPWYRALSRENGQCYLSAEISAIVGWAVLLLVNLMFATA